MPCVNRNLRLASSSSSAGQNSRSFAGEPKDDERRRKGGAACAACPRIVAVAHRGKDSEEKINKSLANAKLARIATLVMNNWS